MAGQFIKRFVDVVVNRMIQHSSKSLENSKIQCKIITIQRIDILDAKIKSYRASVTRIDHIYPLNSYVYL
jgi:hypothetical protein